MSHVNVYYLINIKVFASNRLINIIFSIFYIDSIIGSECNELQESPKLRSRSFFTFNETSNSGFVLFTSRPGIF